MHTQALGIFILICAIAPIVLGPLYMWWIERPPRPSKKNEGHGGIDGTTMAGFSAASGGSV